MIGARHHEHSRRCLHRRHRCPDGHHFGPSRLGQLQRRRAFYHQRSREDADLGRPATHITLNDKGGTWEGTRPPLYRMQARSLTQDMLKPGTTVTVEGYPPTQKQCGIRAERIIIAGRSVELR
jgi:hypothetical protein